MNFVSRPRSLILSYQRSNSVLGALVRKIFLSKETVLSCITYELSPVDYDDGKKLVSYQFKFFKSFFLKTRFSNTISLSTLVPRSISYQTDK